MTKTKLERKVEELDTNLFWVRCGFEAIVEVLEKKKLTTKDKLGKRMFELAREVTNGKNKSKG